MELSVKLPVFEGPLDLLLHLIDKNKIDIYSKVIDEGKYKIYDNNNKIIAKYEGYVPKFFECL